LVIKKKFITMHGHINIKFCLGVIYAEFWNLDGELGKGQDKMDCWDSNGWGLERGGTAKLDEERCISFDIS
jgi:hypothetical protein